jgi:hypothetical protein
MGTIRAFRMDDIAQVAALWARVFRGGGAPSPPLCDYFERVFFGHPWPDEELPSLVYADAGGRAVGFIGVIPRPMMFEGRLVRAAVSTQLMIDPDCRSPLAAVELLRTLFAGPQDLCYSDGANDRSARVWQGAGGRISSLYCMEWTRALRPLRMASHRLEARRAVRPLLRAAAPILRALDVGAARSPLGPYRLPGGPVCGADATAAEILALLSDPPGRPLLKPTYDAASLQWVLQMAAERKATGRLRHAVVTDAGGRAAGWYVYYANPAGVSHVLQLGGTDRGIDRVLDQLFRDAYRHGSLAVSGQMEPRFIRQLSDHHCKFSCPSLGVLVHTRNERLLHAIDGGSALLSRLEGEWWLKFSSDAFG